MGKVRTAILASALFAASMIVTLLATDRFDHDGTANLPVVNWFFPAPDQQVECRRIVGPSLRVGSQLAKTAVTHPDTVQAVFRPLSDGRPLTAKVGFQFSYEVEPGHEERAFERITAKWADATTATRELLEQQDVHLLTAHHGIEVVQQELIEALNDTLFQSKDGKRFAAVTGLVWKDWLLQ